MAPGKCTSISHQTSCKSPICILCRTALEQQQLLIILEVLIPLISQCSCKLVYLLLEGLYVTCSGGKLKHKWESFGFVIVDFSWEDGRRLKRKKEINPPFLNAHTSFLCQLPAERQTMVAGHQKRVILHVTWIIVREKSYMVTHPHPYCQITGALNLKWLKNYLTLANLLFCFKIKLYWLFPNYLL